MAFKAVICRVALSPANILMFSGVIAAFHLGKVSPAIPTLQHTLGLTTVQAGFLLSLMQLAGALAGVAMGMFSDKLGARTSIIVGQLLLCIASAVATSIQCPSALLALRALESLGFLMVVLPTPGLLRCLVTPERRAFRLGLWGCYIAMGTAAAFIMGPGLIESVGWKGWWQIPAAGSLLCIVLLVVAVPPARPPCNTLSEEPWHGRLRRVLTARGPWCTGMAFAMYSGQWMAVIGFLPTIYNEAGMTRSVAGTLTALAALVNILGNVTAATLIHRGVGKKHLLLLGYLFILAMAAVAFSSATQGMPVLRYLAILLFSAVGGVIPATLFILAVETAPDNSVVAASVGWVQQLSALGMLLMPPMLARLAELTGGWHWTWLATGVAAIIGLLLSLAIATPAARGV